MCRPHDASPYASDCLIEKEIYTKQCNDNTGTVTTIILVTVTFIGGYGLGVNDTDVRMACFIGASVLFLFALIFNFDHLQQQCEPFFRWVSRQTTFTSISLGRMASKRSGNALSTLSRVTSVDAIKSISNNFLSTLDCSKSIRSAIQSITRKECFARLDYIERLSINDISIIFRYAADASLDGFDKEKFSDDQTQIVRSVITAIDMAVKVSRGSLSEGMKIISTAERSAGDVDALRFVAATRVFAEWRNLRMSPKGYQRYAIGLSLGYRDILQNLEKIERGVHEYLRHYQTFNKESGKDPNTPIPSPTLRQLLGFEARINIHKKLPILKEQSSASGLLWTKRQLHYQTVILSNSLEVPESHASGEEAARAAYRTVYNNYHGWAVKQIFTRSFGGSPPLDKFWLTICPPTDSPKIHGGTNHKYKHKRKPSQEFPDVPHLLRAFSETNSSTSVSMSERTETQEEDNEVLVALDNFRHGIVEKWEDTLRMFNCGKQEKRKLNENLILSSESYFNLNQLNRDMVDSSLQNNTGIDISDINSIVSASTNGCSSTSSTLAATVAETAVSRQKSYVCSIQKAKEDTEDFIRGISPMIADLGVLIDQLNMNDPSKA